MFRKIARFTMTPPASPRIWLLPLSVGQEGNICFWTPLFFNAPHHSCKYLFRILHTYKHFWLTQCTVRVFPATPWPAFFFVAPIKFVLVSRVTRMTIHKWNKKVKLYAVFIHASTRRCKHVWVWVAQIKKVLSRWDKFLFCRQTLLKMHR